MNLLVLNRTKGNRKQWLYQTQDESFLLLDSCGAHNLLHRFKRSKSIRQEACSANEESQWGPGYILRAVRMMEG